MGFYVGINKGVFSWIFGYGDGDLGFWSTQ